MTGPPAGGDGWSERAAGGPHEGPDRVHAGRGLALVIVAVVVGVLLLPSATRAPLAASAKASTTSTTVAGKTTTPGHGAHPSSTTTTTVAPASIHVLVANATTVNGVAGAVTTFLTSKGFGTLTATNALIKVTASEIYTVGGATADVPSVAAALGLPAASIEPAAASAPVQSTTGANVVVIVGPDLAARFTPGATTTVPPG
jgi:hypothetical protein